jgi:hypothetical protein
MLEGFSERRREAMKVQEATPLAERREGAQRGAADAASTDERWLVAQAKSGRSSAFPHDVRRSSDGRLDGVIGCAQSNSQNGNPA